jgi:hypothetical protein
MATNKFFANNKVESFDHDPGSTAALEVTPDGGTTQRWVDMANYGSFSAIAMTSVLGGNGITKLEILANDKSDGSGTDVVIKDSGTVAADAVGDYVVEECTAEELAQEGADNSVNLRYVCARLTCHHAGDEAVVTYIRSKPRFAENGLTADYISA